jgi:hypothetical protein
MINKFFYLSLILSLFITSQVKAGYDYAGMDESYIFCKWAAGNFPNEIYYKFQFKSEEVR